jgi:hypothetical protein
VREELFLKGVETEGGFRQPHRPLA